MTAEPRKSSHQSSACDVVFVDCEVSQDDARGKSDEETPLSVKLNYREYGRIVVTPGIFREISAGYRQKCLMRHMPGDHGVISDKTRENNRKALTDKSLRICSQYPLHPRKKRLPGVPIEALWILTEPGREKTFILLPKELRLQPTES